MKGMSKFKVGRTKVSLLSRAATDLRASVGDAVVQLRAID